MSHQIDILLPVYNVAPYIQEAIESILDQTYQDFCLFIIDDCSTDNTLDIVNKLPLQANDKITIIPNTKKQGIVKCLNQGMKFGTAPYIARMDGDDISHPDRLAIQFKLMEQNLEILACSGSYKTIDENGLTLRSHSPSNEPSDCFRSPAHQHFLLHPFLMLRREILEKISGYQEVTHCEDADLYYRIEEHGKLHNLAEELGKYRIHKDAISSKSLNNLIIQSLNSQLCALMIQRAKRNQSNYQFPYSKNREIAKWITEGSPSLRQIVTKSQSILELNKKERKWLHQSLIIKFTSMLANRKVKTPLRYYYEITDFALISIFSLKKKKWVLLERHLKHYTKTSCEQLTFNLKFKALILNVLYKIIHPIIQRANSKF